jgi:hypothetical protein
MAGSRVFGLAASAAAFFVFFSPLFHPFLSVFYLSFYSPSLIHRDTYPQSTHTHGHKSVRWPTLPFSCMEYMPRSISIGRRRLYFLSFLLVAVVVIYF